MTTKYSPSTGAMATKLQDGKIVALQYESQKYYTLNDTGSFIWEKVCDGADTDMIEAALQQEFSLTPEHASKTTAEFISKLLGAELIEVSS